MSYPFGAVLLIPFPFTDGSGTKPRPALVLWDDGDDDLLLAPITTHEPRSESDVAVEQWAEAGLKTASTVRVGKLNTIARRIVIRRIGQLRPADEEKFRAVLKTFFRSILENS